MELIDTHAHLDFPDYDQDRDAVVARAREAGVTRIITIGTDLVSQEKNAALVRRYPEIYQAVGIHPADSKEFESESTIARLRTFTSGERVVAIGEIGLDFARDPSGEERELQRAVFIAQLRLAQDLHLPISLHSRAAEEECVRIIRETVSARPFQGGVAHCFAGSVKTALELIELGFLVSISGIATFRNAPEVQALATHLPLEKLVLETDAPFLSPERGKRNEPAAVRVIAEKVAELRGTSAEEVAAVTTKNARWLFNV